MQYEIGLDYTEANLTKTGKKVDCAKSETHIPLKDKMIITDCHQQLSLREACMCNPFAGNPF